MGFYLSCGGGGRVGRVVDFGVVVTEKKTQSPVSTTPSRMSVRSERKLTHETRVPPSSSVLKLFQYGGTVRRNSGLSFCLIPFLLLYSCPTTLQVPSSVSILFSEILWLIVYTSWSYSVRDKIHEKSTIEKNGVLSWMFRDINRDEVSTPSPRCHSNWMNWFPRFILTSVNNSEDFYSFLTFTLKHSRTK